MPFAQHNQEETDARELAKALLAALGAPADHPSLRWAETAYRAVLDGQSCAMLKETPDLDAIVGTAEQEDTPLVLRGTAAEPLLYLRHMEELLSLIHI